MRITNKHVFWLKVLMHVVALLPIIYLVLAVLGDEAGGDPVQYIIHYTGIGALNTFLITLCISPIAKKFKQGALIQTRRLLGLYVFAYATLHLMAFISLDLLFEWTLFFQETVKRPYIVVGTVAYLLLLALSVTSLNAVRRKMGKRWQQLHNSVYLVAVLVPIHFFWSVKSEIIEPSIYIAVAALLLFFRKSQIQRIFKRK